MKNSIQEMLQMSQKLLGHYVHGLQLWTNMLEFQETLSQKE